MSSHVNQLFAGQEMASLHLVGSGVSWTGECVLVAITPALYDSPIDRTNGSDDGYRSHTNKPFGSSPDFLTEHSAFQQVLGVIPDRRMSN